MSEKSSPISAQTIVVAIMFIAAGGWILFSPGKSTNDVDPVDVEEEDVEVSEALPEKMAPPPTAEPVTPVENWATFHGGPSLQGVSGATIPDNLEVLWRFQSDSAVFQPPVYSEGLLFFTSRKGGVFALDKSGNEVWSKHIQYGNRRDGSPRMERFDAPIAVHKGVVFVGSLNGNLYAFDAKTGEEKWTYFIDAPILGTANFHVTEDGKDVLYILNQEAGNLYALDFHTSEKLWMSEFVERCDGSPSIGNGRVVYGSCANALHVFSAEDGSLLTEIELDPDSQVAGGVAIVGDSAFSGAHSGRLFHADLSSGKIVWINESSEDEIFSTPAVTDTLVIFGSLDGYFYALDRNTGEEKWSFETDGITVSPVVAGSKVIACSDGVIYILNVETGEQIWSYELSDEISSPGIVDNMILVGADDGTVTAFGTKE